MTDLAIEKNETEPFQLGDPVEHRGVVVCPLFPLGDPRAHYLTLEDALPRGLRVEEIGAGGSVPELRVVNPLAENVLLYDGEELVGAKQNRILNVSVLVGGKSELPIPVSCVEEGRWRQVSPAFGASPQAAHPELRRRKAESLRHDPLARGISQGEVWDEVLTMHARGVSGPTGEIVRMGRWSSRRCSSPVPVPVCADRGVAHSPGPCGRNEPMPAASPMSHFPPNATLGVSAVSER